LLPERQADKAQGKRDKDNRMAIRQFKKLSEDGALFYGDLLVANGAYELQMTEEYGKISGHFDAKAKVLRMEDAREPTLELAGGQRIELEISGSRATDRIDFAIVDDESIKICRNIV